ncbi:MAG: class I SAM-dependent methyltransferase [Proteobacteria bacterium]|nr:class I SAM-dependent methyltransferase [Pseudomonadota bacterium]
MVKELKLKLTPGILKLAYKFIDVESLGESSVLDGRTTEYGFALSKLVRLPVGKLLDIGCVTRVNPIVSTMCELGWKVYGMDIRDYRYTHPNFKFVKGDITQKILEDNFFNAITAISTLEHIGVGGRYGIRGEDGLAPTRAMANIKRLLKPGGTLVITLPYRKSPEESTMGRTYTPSMINKLLRYWNMSNIDIQNGLILLDLVEEKE